MHPRSQTQPVHSMADHGGDDDAATIRGPPRAARVERGDCIARVRLLALAPVAYLLCCRPTLPPLPCRDGDLVGLWPRHPARTCIRLDAVGHLLGYEWLPTDDLFSIARHLVLGGTMRQLTADCAALITRPGKVSWTFASA